MCGPKSSAHRTNKNARSPLSCAKPYAIGPLNGQWSAHDRKAGDERNRGAGNVGRTRPRNARTDRNAARVCSCAYDRAARLRDADPRRAGYGKESKPATLSKHAHDLSRNPKIIEAINEEAKKVTRGAGHAEALAALFNMVRDPMHKDHARAVAMIMDRVHPTESKHSIDVTYRTVDPDREALEEMKAARQLGASREKLLELFGANGLDRLEALEVIENAQRAAAAKVIEHNG